MIDFDGMIKHNEMGSLIPLEYELSSTRLKNKRFKAREGLGAYEKVFYPNDSAILCWINNEHGSFSTHWHPSIEIIMPLDNNYTVKINNNKYILKEGDILIIPPGELHELYETDKSNGYRLILLFDYTAVNNMKGFSSIWPLLTVPSMYNEENSPSIYNEIKKILIQILLEYINDEPHWELSMYMQLMHFFVIIGRNRLNCNSFLPDPDTNKQQEYVYRFNAVYEFIDKKYMDDITLEDAAEVANFSKFHFARLFKMFTNTSFGHYLMARRVRAAEELLLNPSLPITDIALMSGFSSISTFNRVFKSFKNCTPTDFKEYLNNDNQSIHSKIV